MAWPYREMFGSATPWPARDVVAKVRELGGAVVAAHPYDKTVEKPSGDFIFTLDGLAAIEGLNVRRRGPANDLAVEAADHMSLPCTGGSGALEALDPIGKAATLFKEPVASEADLVRQLRAGAVFCVAIVPALLSVAMLLFGVQEPDRTDGKGKCLRQLTPRPGIHWTYDPEPEALAGSPEWSDYTVAADVLIEKTGTVGIFGRVG